MLECSSHTSKCWSHPCCQQHRPPYLLNYGSDPVQTPFWPWLLTKSQWLKFRGGSKSLKNSLTCAKWCSQQMWHACRECLSAGWHLIRWPWETEQSQKEEKEQKVRGAFVPVDRGASGPCSSKNAKPRWWTRSPLLHTPGAVLMTTLLIEPCHMYQDVRRCTGWTCASVCDCCACVLPVCFLGGGVWLLS